MYVSYSHRLYPNKAQRIALDSMLWAYRRLYNAALAERKDAWQERQESVSFFAQTTGLLKRMRKEDSKLATFSFTAAMQTLRRLDKAFAAFFRRIKSGDKPGYPRFKSRNRFNSADFVWGDSAAIKNRGLVQGSYLAKS